MTQRSLRARRLASVAQAVGDTPHVRLASLAREAPGVEIYAKLEFCNPGGSVKDRAALRILEQALAAGELGRGRALIDSTSGNTGVAYALYGAALGVPIALVVPSNVSQARKDITSAFGAELIYSDPMEGSDGAMRLCQELAAAEPARYFYADQYGNPNNPLAHYHGTGVEILAALGDRITHFVAGLGTTGTMMGTARRLREHDRPIRCIAVEPADALHGLEGLKHLPSSLVPAIHDAAGYDETVRITTEDGWDMAERMAHDEGLHIGHSAGAAVFAALGIAKGLAARGEPGCVVCIVPDRGDRYFAPLAWDKEYQW